MPLNFVSKLLMVSWSNVMSVMAVCIIQKTVTSVQIT